MGSGDRPGRKAAALDDEHQDLADEDDRASGDDGSDEDEFPDAGQSRTEDVLESRRWLGPVVAAAAAVIVVGAVFAAIWLWPEGSGDLRAGIPRLVMDVPPPGRVESLVSEAVAPPPPAPSASASPAPAASSGPAALTPAARPEGAAPQTAAAPAQGDPAGTLVSPASAVAFAQLPPKRPAKPLGEVPDPALVEQGPDGPLPKVDGKGRQPWQVYAAPAAAPQGWPRIGILIEGLGMSRVETEVAIDRLPGAVSLGFSPYASELAVWTVRARQNGHETFLGLPLEAERFPIRDAGPLALVTGIPVPENAKRLQTVLGRATGYVGVTSYMGERFLATAHQVRPLLQSLKTRGLAFVDVTQDGGSLAEKVGQELRLPFMRAHLRLDDTPSRVAVDLRLAELEAVARRDLKVVGVGRAYPATLERLVHWIRGLEAKNIALVPVTSLVEEAKAP